jgi:hypothetical protein
LSVQWVSSSVEPGTLPSQEMVGPEAARDGDTASPYGTKRKEREVSPSVGIAAVIAMNIKVHGYGEGWKQPNCVAFLQMHKI